MNVMKKAWEIARNGQKKFGGKVREYFAQALKMAWAIVKKSVDNKFGFRVHSKVNGMLYFLVDDLDGMEVSFLTTKKNLYNGKMYNKNHHMSFRTGIDKTTNQKMRLYSISLDNEAVEIKVVDKKETFKINRGNLAWV